MNKFFKKRQILLPVLVLILAAAIYINWQFGSSNAVDKNTSSADTNLGAAEYVAAQNVGVSSQSEQEQYFDKARADREKARNNAIAELEEIKNDVKASEDEVSAAIKQRMLIASYIEKEANIETLVKAKGFADCVAVINADNVNIVVLSDALDSSEVLQIQDIVVSQYEIALDKIKVINVE